MRGIAIDLASPVPVYRQIADEIRGLVARGDLTTGEELPSVRVLAARVGVNLNTVAKAYRILADEGLIDLRHGAGARVKATAPPRTSTSPAHAIDEESRRRLRDLLSRWVLGGATRRSIERAFADALEEYFRCISR